MKEIVKNKLNIPGHKIDVIENGVDLNKFKNKNINSENKQINYGYAGILKKNYGLEELIKCFNNVRSNRNIVLNIAGDGPQKTNYPNFPKTKT